MTADGSHVYEFRLAGHLDPHWTDRLGRLGIAHHDDGTTTLAGPVVDQAQLHGILAGIRDIGAELLAVTRRDDPVAERV